VRIRDATPDEMAEVGEIRVAAYVAGGSMSTDSEYASTLRELGADGNDVVLVAVFPDQDGSVGGAAGSGAGQGGRGAGTVMLQAWTGGGEVVTGPDQAEIRALAVRPDAQGRGVGTELLRHVIERAAGMGVSRLMLATLPGMRAARRLYERAGFVRRPERDWSPAPGTILLVYEMRLAPGQPR